MHCMLGTEVAIKDITKCSFMWNLHVAIYCSNLQGSKCSLISRDLTMDSIINSFDIN